MKQASINDIKQELQNLSAKEIAAYCLRLAKFKKENKEFLSYLLFEADDIDGYTTSIKDMMDESFKEVNTSNLYLAKKTLRKILRITNRHIKYTANKQTEVILLIHFCTCIKMSGIRLKKSTSLQNIYLSQLKKVMTAISALHEDIQYDLLKEVKALE